MSKVYVPGSGPSVPKLMILGDCPTSKDTQAGHYFAGGDGRELSYICKDAGINLSECWVTAVSKYEVPPNYKGDKKIPFAIRAQQAGIDMPTQLKELQEEINSIKPNCILALSSTALWALSGKTDIVSHRGSILHGMGTKFVPTYHPHDLLFSDKGAEFKGYYNRQIMAFDFRRAKEESQNRELVLPNRTLEICRNSHQLAEFWHRYKNTHKKVYVDIESGNTCLPICVGFAFTPGHGICVPLWNTNGISTIPDSDLTQIWILVDAILRHHEVVGQNFNYDRDRLKRYGFTIPKFVGDTMYKAFAINPELPKSLGFNTSIYTREPFYKDEGMYFGSINDLFTGCARDSCVTCEVDQNMDSDLDEIGQRKFYENFLMRLPDLYWGIEQQGFRVDSEARKRLLQKYIAWDERLRLKLYQLTGTDINVNSPKQIGILLFENLKLPRKPNTGEESITELLNSPKVAADERVTEILEAILEDRRVRKTISTYMMALPDYDGRMRTTCFPCLETGRSNTGQQDEPIRPAVEVFDEDGKKKKKSMGIAFQTMTKHGDIGADVREMYVPDLPAVLSPFERQQIEYEIGRPLTDEDLEEVFIQADSSQAEARVVWLLADDEEALKLVDTIDYHAYTAVWFFGPNEELFNYDKKKLGYEHPIRFCGKTLRHAGHLGAGKRRASISVNTDARKFKIPIHISEAVAERALKIFHAKQPKIQQVFQASVIDCLKRNRVLVAPVPYGVDSEVGGRRTFYERWGEELFRQAFSYIPQRTVTDNTKGAGLRIKQRCPGIKITMESHDALLFCIPKYRLSTWVPIIREEFERPIDFSRCSIPRRSLVIPCELEIGNNYYEFKKFKFDFQPTAKPMLTTSELPVRELNVTERFTVVNMPRDTKLDNDIYSAQERKYGI
jgi:uracil-DNA glycosylase family 4